MRIGVLDIMPQPHYPMVESTIRIFSSSPSCEVYIFTHATARDTLKSIPLINQDNIHYVVKQESESFSNYISEILKYNIERLYVITPEKYFYYYYLLSKKIPLFAVIHNIDEWFDFSPTYRWYCLIRDFSNHKNIIYHLKKNFLYPIWKKLIAINILKGNGKFVVLNSHLKNEVAKYVDKNRIEVIPFSIFEKNLISSENKNDKIRICIPGTVSQYRRDYISILNMLEMNSWFKDKIELDLLGYLDPNENTLQIVEKIDSLIEKGYTLFYYRNFISPVTFDHLLSKSTVVLGNINVNLDRYSKYGRTKDTGVIYTMIKAGKPGILPKDYLLIDDLKSSTLFYDNYKILEEILKKIINEKDVLKLLKNNAIKNSEKYLPENIYRSITK